jgi:hypothetical protein
MECKIFVTHTESWERYSSESYISYLENEFFFNNDDYKKRFIDNVRSWNETYSPHYAEFRHKIKEIASKNIRKSGFPVVIQQEAQKVVTSYKDTKSNEFYIICDDDDFINPESPGLIMSIFDKRPDIDLIYWDIWQYKTCSAREEFYLYDKEEYGNCLAVRGGLEDWRCYKSGAHVYIPEIIPKEKTLKIRGFHSLWNIHSASFYINQTYPLDQQIRTPKRSKRVKYFDWAKEEVEAMFLLAENLKRIK